MLAFEAAERFNLETTPIEFKADGLTFPVKRGICTIHPKEQFSLGDLAVKISNTNDVIIEVCNGIGTLVKVDSYALNLTHKEEKDDWYKVPVPVLTPDMACDIIVRNLHGYVTELKLRQVVTPIPESCTSMFTTVRHRYMMAKEPFTCDDHSTYIVNGHPITLTGKCSVTSGMPAIERYPQMIVSNVNDIKPSFNAFNLMYTGPDDYCDVLQLAQCMMVTSGNMSVNRYVADCQ